MKTLYIFSLLLCLISCDKITKKAVGIDLSDMDTLVKPSENFYKYANGGWLDRTVIPNDMSSWGSFNEVRENTEEILLNLIKSQSHNKSLVANSEEMKVVNLFESIMDTVNRKERGLSPINPYLKKINDIKTTKDLEHVIADASPYFNLGFIESYVYSDAKDSRKNVVYVSEPELGLFDREYYVSDAPDNKEKRMLYKKQISKIFNTYFGNNPQTATSKAQKVLDLETILAYSMLDRVELRDDRKTYNPMSFSKAQSLVPEFDLKDYIQTIGLPKLDTVVITQPKYMKTFQHVLKTGHIESWKAYMTWNLFRESAAYLSTDIEKSNWDFYSKTLRGVKKQRPLEKRALGIINNSIGEALGKLYIKDNFPPDAKIKAKEMVSYLFKAYKKRIKDLEWMDEATKSNALKKLDKIRAKIGYPDRLKKYLSTDIRSPKQGGNYFDNMMSYAMWDHKYNISKYGKPVDKDEWGMPPQTVNAYYNPSNNEIVFPAAILQPPFYNYKVDYAINFGGIGAVIGHEISHGFDDSGSRYDAEGNLNNWWTKDDLRRFNSLGNKLANQFSAIEPLPGIFIDGKFTLGENIGDLGGVNSALEGLKLCLKDKGVPDLIDGFTPEQRFFISWATIWRTKTREEAIKRQVKVDPHSPGQYRAYMPLLNIDAFYKSFDINTLSKIHVPPSNRVKIW